MINRIIFSILIGAFSVLFPRFGIAAIEGKYTETETSMERDEGGVVLNDAGDVHRDLPGDRTMYRVGSSNVVKAEDKDRYVNRLMLKIKKEMEDRLNTFDQRISTMELAVHQLNNEVKRATPRKTVSKIEADISTAKATSTATSTTTTII